MRVVSWALLALSLGRVLAQDPEGGNSSSRSSSSVSASSTASASASRNSSTLSGSQTPSPTTNATQSPGGVVTTTITSLVAGPSNSTQTATFVLTLTLDQAGQANTTTNSTSSSNSTATTPTPWNDTLSYLPFTPHLDAAFGVGGAFLILSGIPVATLGGKNRWSALAIVSGYSIGLFTLVFILSFGVAPALEPPSPHPPTATTRGLYLLALGVSFLIGSGLGIFFYTFAKYWVGAAGGFALGWFIVSLRKGGLVNSTGGRWGIIGGLTVVMLFCSLVPLLHDFVLLGASAWVGATLFILGVDCFTRAGLKEFYVYNLGYHSLFPSLNGGKFPMTQSMQVELGAIAAAALIAGAIQFKVVSLLQKRRKQIIEEEEARIEAQQIAIAAENFKNVDAELAEWEGKHGDGRDHMSEVAPVRGFEGNRTPSTLVGGGPSSPGIREKRPASIYRAEVNRVEPNRISLLEEMGFTEDGSQTRPSTTTPVTADEELEQKIQLLQEVRRARESVASSRQALRSSTTTPTFETAVSAPTSRPLTAASMRVRGSSDSGRPGHSRNNSASSRILSRGRYDSGSSSARLLGDATRPRLSEGNERPSHDESAGAASTSSGRFLSVDDSLRASSYRRDSLGARTLLPSEELVARPTSATEKLADISVHSGPAVTFNDKREMTEWEKRLADHDQYTKSRTIISPEPARTSEDYTRRSADFAVVSGAVASSLNSPLRGARKTTPGQEYGSHLARVMSQSGSTHVPAPAPAPRRPSADRRPSRTMTNDELAHRHREALAKLQDTVSGPMKEELAVQSARDEWNTRTRAEREAQRRREKERLPKHERGDTAASKPTPILTDRAPPRSSERQRRTEEWRKSIPISPVSPTTTLPVLSPRPRRRGSQNIA